MPKITVALDAMGGDYGMEVIVPAAFNVLKKHPHLQLILVGDQEKLREFFTAHHLSEFSLHQ